MNRMGFEAGGARRLISPAEREGAVSSRGVVHSGAEFGGVDEVVGVGNRHSPGNNFQIVSISLVISNSIFGLSA